MVGIKGQGLFFWGVGLKPHAPVCGVIGQAFFCLTMWGDKC